MKLIRFRDMRGVEWEVWEVGCRGLADSAPAIVEGDRWLCFTSATQRRRLANYPDRWYTLPPRELDALCRAATRARSTLPGGVPVVGPAAHADDARSGSA